MLPDKYHPKDNGSYRDQNTFLYQAVNTFICWAFK